MGRSNCASSTSAERKWKAIEREDLCWRGRALYIPMDLMTLNLAFHPCHTAFSPLSAHSRDTPRTGRIGGPAERKGFKKGPDQGPGRVQDMFQVVNEPAACGSHCEACGRLGYGLTGMVSPRPSTAKIRCSKSQPVFFRPGAMDFRPIYMASTPVASIEKIAGFMACLFLVFGYTFYGLIYIASAPAPP